MKYAVIKINKSNTPECIISFDNKEECEQYIKKYYCDLENSFNQYIQDLDEYNKWFIEDFFKKNEIPDSYGELRKFIEKKLSPLSYHYVDKFNIKQILEKYLSYGNIFPLVLDEYQPPKKPFFDKDKLFCVEIK